MDAAPVAVPRPRAPLRLRLAVLCGGAATAVGLLTLLMSLALVDQTAAGVSLSVDSHAAGDGTGVTVYQDQQELRRAVMIDLVSRGLLLVTAFSGLAFAISYGLVGGALGPLQRITGRLAAATDAQRRFVADAGHELRTPVSVVRTEIEVALADPDASAAELRAAMLVVLEANRRSEAMIESLLVLAYAYAADRPAEPISA